MTNLPPLSKCPHCKARGTYREDAIVFDHLVLNFPYCGVCGRNWRTDEPLRIVRVDEGDRA